MKGTVGTKKIVNIENTNPEIISASRKRLQPGSHVSRKKIAAEISLLYSPFLCKLRLDCRNHAPFQWTSAAKNSAHTETEVTCTYNTYNH